MLLLNSILTILVLGNVGAVEIEAEKPILRTLEALESNKDIIVKISPEAIVKSFRAVVSSDYLRTLAEEFAQKAASHFINIVKGSDEQKLGQDKPAPKTKTERPNTIATLITQPDIKKKEKYLVNKEDVLTLLREPAIDGDNLQQTLSDEVTEAIVGNTGKLKINGAYYKRHNIAVKPTTPSNRTKTSMMTKLIQTLKTTDTTTENNNLATTFYTTTQKTNNLTTTQQTNNLTSIIYTTTQEKNNFTTTQETNNLTTTH